MTVECVVGSFCLYECQETFRDVSIALLGWNFEIVSKEVNLRAFHLPVCTSRGSSPAGSMCMPLCLSSLLVSDRSEISLVGYPWRLPISSKIGFRPTRSRLVRSNLVHADSPPQATEDLEAVPGPPRRSQVLHNVHYPSSIAFPLSYTAAWHPRQANAFNKTGCSVDFSPSARWYASF